MKMDKSLLKKLVALAGALVFAALAGVDFYDHRHSKETVVASDALTETHMLSEWLPNLEGTYGDTPVFFFDSGVEGGTVLYVGGTHPYILCISYELTVQPQIHCLFHAFKADTDSLGTQLRIQIKAFDIGTYRIILSFAEHSGSVSGALHAVGASAVFFSLPWVHGIDVADLIISSQFNMARHHDLIKVFRIKILFIEVFRSALNILTENKFPLSI